MTLEYFFQVITAFLFIGSLLFICYKLSLNYKKKVFTGDLKLRDRLSLNKNTSLVIVDYINKSYLLTVSDNSVSLIQDISLSSGQQKNILDKKS